METARLSQPDVKSPQVVNGMPETKPNWVTPRKFAALAKNLLIHQWLVSYPALNTKNERLKRFGAYLSIEYKPEQIVKDLEDHEDGKKKSKALKAKVKTYCAGLADRRLTATASLTLSSFRSFLTSQEITMTWTRQDMIPVIAVRTDRRVSTKAEVYRILGASIANLTIVY